jgi:predicted  nucleic acid-binding Zn-ribbon protein
MWPELLKAKENINEIEKQIDQLLKNHNSLTKKEIAEHNDTMIAEFEASLEAINDQLNEFAMHMKNHHKYLHSKSSFIKRHYSRKV